MRKRMKMPRKRSRKLFRATASKTHRKNLGYKVMRGGIRL